MSNLFIVTLLLGYTLKSVVAECYYDDVNNDCVFLDDISTTCYQCSSFTDNLINAVPNSINVVKYVGPCGCVILVNNPRDQVS